MALLSDQRFFVRLVPIAPGSEAQSVASQVELTLEAISPFPPAQLFFGYCWSPGSAHALVFSCYRKRFPIDQVSEWDSAELVIPTFAALAAMEVKPATTVLYPTADGLTAVHWADAPVPVRVLTAPIAAEATDEERAKVREALLRSAGESREIIELTTTPEIAVSESEQAFRFRAGEFEAQLPRDTAATFDVRDPGELDSYRRGARRDLMLWRVTAGSVVLLAALAVGQVLLSVGGGMLTTAQQIRIREQTPLVNEIEGRERLAASIERLASEHLLPLEMLSLIYELPQRGQINFTRATATEAQLDTLVVACTTPNAADAENYRIALEALPEVEGVAVSGLTQGRGGANAFTLTINFVPGAMERATRIASTEP